ncbi:major capsid protein [Staphylococcus pettenkoferi]|uniref:major capsid protein n=1 Tax=Staphylococcus pettenkoferi TaxID=170573 RepID=UPI0022729571|nr:major capsid protein [Staphylococcus pettenkoferi]MCY1563822.1 major capsid protein [Staphylococcus pettenkoferi]
MVVEDKHFEQSNLTAFIKASDENRDINTQYPLSTAFPVEEVEEISNVYDIIETQLNVAASITGFNSGAPIRDKGQGKQALAKLTKIQDAYYLDETELLHYRNPRTDAERQKIIDNVLMSTDELSDGIEKTKELMRAQMTYKGAFIYEDPRTETQINFSLDRPEENDLTATKEWGTKDAEPISDLIAAVEQYQKTNGNAKPEVINMNSKTYNKLKRSGQVKLELYDNTNSPRIVKDDSLTELVQSFGLPQIQIDDSQTPIEQLDGTRKIVKHLDDDKVVLRAAVLGKTLSGPSVENNFAKGKFATTVASQDPVSEKTIVGEVALPITQNINGTVYINTKPSATTSSEQ